MVIKNIYLVMLELDNNMNDIYSLLTKLGSSMHTSLTLIGVFEKITRKKFN
jgi:hypothetical protein